MNPLTTWTEREIPLSNIREQNKYLYKMGRRGFSVVSQGITNHQGTQMVRYVMVRNVAIRNK